MNRTMGIGPGDAVLVVEHRGAQDIVHHALVASISMREELKGRLGEPAIEAVFINAQRASRDGSAGLELFAARSLLGQNKPQRKKDNDSRADEVPHMKATELLDVIRKQHNALDTMLAQRAIADLKFYPSRSGAIWDAIILSNNAILRLEAEVRGEPVFDCPLCHAISYHPKDIEFGYCGRCHDFTGGRPEAKQ